MRALQASSLIGIAVLLFSACANRTAQQPAPSTAQPQASQAAPASKPISAKSPLAKIKNGMTYQQVTEILGQPTSQNAYMSGKAFVPFYFGNDVRRTGYYYKGLGRVVFAAGNAFGGGAAGEVERVDYDPSEPGHPR